MADEEKDGIRVQVAAAKPQDVGKGVARLSQKALRALELSEGEVVEIAGKRTTAAIAL
ncbi:MAG TPA: hypothetical protein VMT16_00005, partial [Thermoanaerobaculia bacterium]|nr:hypothetical protein [Thermoanaerobaculia bacterium]